MWEISFTMVRPYSTRTVNFSQDIVWRLLSDLESPTQYHPYVQNVEITSTQQKGLGSRRIVHFVDGRMEVEEVVQVGQGSITFKTSSLLEGKTGMGYTLTYTVKSILPSWTEITLHVRLDLHVGLVGMIRRVLVPITAAERRLYRTLYHVLEGIEYHLSTKKRVPKVSFRKQGTKTRRDGAIPSRRGFRRGHSSAVGTT